MEARGAFVVSIAEMITVLNPFATVLQNRADFFGERVGFMPPGNSTAAGWK